MGRVHCWRLLALGGCLGTLCVCINDPLLLPSSGFPIEWMHELGRVAVIDVFAVKCTPVRGQRALEWNGWVTW